MHEDDAKAGGNTLKLGWQILGHFGHIEPKIPTPTVADQFTDNLKSSQQSEGSMHSVSLAQFVNRPDLLPTPTVVDLGNNKTIDEWEEWTGEQREKHGNGNGHGASLSIEALKLLPTTTASDWKGANHSGSGSASSNSIATVVEKSESWGRFAPAIERWETITERPAPAPTMPDGKNGQHRLSPAFTEWLMGLPEGWITEADITRNEMLKACGNGVVPQQAALALTMLYNGCLDV